MGANTFAKTICSICYEDLKPIVEDLQTISVCGHVFHELCLQQWLEYCTKGKKNCPVCKQNCLEVNIVRLYFQSVGEADDLIPSQTTSYCEESREELRREVKRLSAKVSGLSSALENQQKDFKEVNEELSTCKVHIKKEITLKNEALKQKAVIQHSFQLKYEELGRFTSECVRLQDKNMSLAKELAALKLVSDMNLEEEEVLKLASLGNEANSKETVEILKRSLVIRNKSYKELMAKCNLLGRGEARSMSKLEKANQKIKKLQERVQELETASEVKDNEVLRAMKASRETPSKVDILKGFGSNLNSSYVKKYLSENKTKESVVIPSNLDHTENVSSDLFLSGITKKCKTSLDTCESKKDITNINICDRGVSSYSLIDEDVSEIFAPADKFLCVDSKSRKNQEDKGTIDKCCLSRTKATSFTKHGAQAHQQSDMEAVKTASDAKLEGQAQQQSDMEPIPCTKSTNRCYKNRNPSITVDEDICILDATTKSLLPIKRDVPAVPVSQPGDHCFAGGLMGPDGTNWHLGNWCKRVKNDGSKSFSSEMQGSSSNNGDLIAVGADGRGGQVKVLRSLNQPPLDRQTSTWSKRCKNESNTSRLQSQGFLQIEHFFGKAGQK